MLVQGTKVLVSDQGEYRPVEHLSVGGFFFDPLTEGYYEISDILTRRLEIRRKIGWQGHPLRPVVLKAGSVGDGRPHRDVAVSPFQDVLTKYAPGPDSSTPLVDLQSAERIEASYSSCKRFRRKDATYFAIFTDRPHFMDVSGLLMRTYCSEDFGASDTIQPGDQIMHAVEFGYRQ